MITPGVNVERPATLLDALDVLTLPRRVANWQGMKLVHRTDPPLLEVLEAAVGNSVGGSGGSGRPASERTPVDVAAVELHERITREARKWLAGLGGRAGRDVSPSQMLRSWYVLHLAQPWGDVVEHDYKKALEGWAREILAVVDPPRRLELGKTGEPIPCPECGAEYVRNGTERLDGSIDPNDETISRALAVYEKGLLEECFAQCAVCLTRWDGEFGVRALAFDAEAIAAAKAADEEREQ